jgi:hypothetical protein
MTAGPFFVVGPGRSGTTLVALLLDTLPTVSFRRETGIVWHVLNDIPDWVWARARKRSLLRLKDTFEEVELPAFGVSLRQFAEMVERARTRKDFLDRFFGGTLPEGARQWGENCPGDGLVMETILCLYPEARFIVAYRDPRDVVLSFQRKRFGPDTVPRGALQWLVRMRLAGRFARRHPEAVHYVRYEELIEDPASVMERVVRFLGEPGTVDLDGAFARDESLSGEYRRPIDPTNKGRWTEAAGFDPDPVLRLCGGEMARLGYLEHDPYPALRLQRALRVLVEEASQRLRPKLSTLRRIVRPGAPSRRPQSEEAAEG